MGIYLQGKLIPNRRQIVVMIATFIYLYKGKNYKRTRQCQLMYQSVFVT